MTKIYAFLHKGKTPSVSLWSARFANRVDNRTAGQVTGVILTAMGALLIVLHYWEHISKLIPAVGAVH